MDYQNTLYFPLYQFICFLSWQDLLPSIAFSYSFLLLLLLEVYFVTLGVLGILSFLSPNIQVLYPIIMLVDSVPSHYLSLEITPDWDSWSGSEICDLILFYHIHIKDMYMN